ncbi:unnamed protein product [Echinostoma caproni]|uniref:Condensin complex subunit 2 n=1 Tax=Echinostoma caproni TaxID=27848 RepID=A0A183AJI8_9TREM|nr:unnamed protein product [Echinostoma caproni]
MILSEQRPLGDIAIPKLDSDDEDISFPRMKTRRPASPIRSVEVVLDDENDDDDERLARRKSRLLEPHPASANSPCANSSTAKRREAAAPRGISQAQIGEHYGNCIRLAAENKITAKNAFNLHLIDYMSDMLKKEDFASFQPQPTEDDDGEGALDEDATNPTGAVGKENRKKAQVHRDIIQKQLNKIRSKVLAAKADVDPLFQHQTASYDEGGTAELRLNQLSTLDEACVLILDSSTRIMHTSCKSTSNVVNIAGILDFLSPVQPKNINQLTMCSSLEDFRFMNWDISQMVVMYFFTHVSILSSIKALTQQPPEITEQIIPCGSSAATAATTAFGGDKPVVDAEGESNVAQTSGTDGELFVSSLKSMLDKQYEHFGQLNDHLLGMWAGPEHWRKKAKRRRINPITGRDEEIDGEAQFPNGDDDDDVTVAGKSRKSSRSKKEKTTKLLYLEALAPGENKTRYCQYLILTISLQH